MESLLCYPLAARYLDSGSTVDTSGRTVLLLDGLLSTVMPGQIAEATFQRPPRSGWILATAFFDGVSGE